MREGRKQQGTPGTVRFLKILLAMYVVSGLLLAVLAVLVSRVQQEELVANVGILVIYVISCAMGGLLAGKAQGERRFLWGMLMGAVYFAVLLAVSLVMGMGDTPDWVHLATTMAICVGAGMAGGMVS